MRTAFIALIVVALAVSGGAYYIKYVAVDPPANYRTAEVKLGDLLPTISATGTLEPEETVDVGAQVTGRITEFGIDQSDPQKKKPVDYRTVVVKGQLLAKIDPIVYKAQYDQAEAALENAKANLLQCVAKRDQTKREWERARTLHPTKAISDSDYDMAEANYRVAEANVAVDEAAIKQAEATRDMAKTNLDYTTIESPVDGEIIDRRVNIGQTVVSNMSVSSLFLIAKDLRRIQAWAQVNEADIGSIQVGMPVRFTVDAYPGQTFHGNVIQIRFNAQSTQNVVNYTVVVQTDNSDRRLYPYLTTNLQFELEGHKNVLQVPNAALRWKPSKVTQVAPDARNAAATPKKRANKEGAPAANGGGEAAAPPVTTVKPAKQASQRGRIWAVDGDYVRPVDVKVGVTDGTNTEVSGDGMKEGMVVVIGEIVGAQDTDTTNPFAPKLFKGGTKKGT
jgi:HlyD family secretion protein